MELKDLTETIKIVPEKAAEFILPNEKAFTDFLISKNKEDRIAYIEKTLADIPKLQTDLQSELDKLKHK